jgi:hypothetical protein
VQPRSGAVPIHVDALGMSVSIWRGSRKDPLQFEIWRALRGEVRETTAYDRPARTRQGEMPFAPQTPAIRPPPAVPEVSNKIRAQHARQNFTARRRESVEFSKQRL